MSLNIVVSADVAAAGKQIEDFSKKSRIALNSLSLIAQDLPYGFIGIQNNLPALISSFGALSSNTKEAGSVFKQLTTALAGPAGAYLAFSVVTGAVTYLTQKYGSLNAAILSLSTSNAKLIGIQAELNKEFANALGGTAGETAKIQILAKTLNDLSKPMKERQDAYTALKKIAPEIARGIDEENILSAKNIDLVNKNIKARIEYIKIRARETAILNMVNKNEEERIALEQEYPALLAKKRKAQQEDNKTKGLSFDATKTFNAGLQTEALNLAFATSALDKNVKQRRELYKANENLFKQLTPLVEGTSEYEKYITKGSKSTKEFYSNITGESKALGPAAAFSRFVIGQTNLQVKSIDKLIAARVKNRKEISKEQAVALVPTTLVGGEAFVNLKNIIEQAKNAALGIDLAGIEKTFQSLYTILNNTFFTPLSDLFTNFLQTGKFAFDDFSKAVSQAITKLVSQIVATGIIQLLATIFSGGFGAAAGKGAGTSGFLAGITSVLSGIGKAIGIGGVANPSFGGVQPGGLGMSGQVNLVLRGSDLVGSLNRTNATINRVG